MTNHTPEQKREAWVIDYLYGELNDEQKAVFEHALESDEQLKQLYEKHSSLDCLLPKGTKPLISDERLQGVRWTTFRGVRQSQKPSFLSYWNNLWRIQLPIKVQLTGMALMFLVGLLIGIEPEVSPFNENIAENNFSESTGPWEFVQNDDYKIVDMNLDAYDKDNGEVTFSFALASQSQVRGNITNPSIRRLLTQSLNTESRDDVRLQLTDLFGKFSDNQEIKAALIFALVNDPNPGVRYNAIEHLVTLSEQKEVRQALMYALVNDVNTGIRVEAFLALTENIDKELMDVIRNHSVDDANTFIRERSKRLLENGASSYNRGNGALSI